MSVLIQFYADTSAVMYPVQRFIVMGNGMGEDSKACLSVLFVEIRGSAIFYGTAY